MYPKHTFLHQLSDCFSLHPPSFGANGRCCHSLWHFSVAHWKLPLSFSTTTAFLVRKGIRRLLIGFDIFCPRSPDVAAFHCTNVSHCIVGAVHHTQFPPSTCWGMLQSILETLPVYIDSASETSRFSSVLTLFSSARSFPDLRCSRAFYTALPHSRRSQRILS